MKSSPLLNMDRFEYCAFLAGAQMVSCSKEESLYPKGREYSPSDWHLSYCSLTMYYKFCSLQFLYFNTHIYISRSSIKDHRTVIQHLWVLVFFLRKHNDFQLFEFCLYHQKFCLPENSCLCMYHLVSIILECMGPVYAKGWV